MMLFLYEEKIKEIQLSYGSNNKKERCVHEIYNVLTKDEYKEGESDFQFRDDVDEHH